MLRVLVDASAIPAIDGIVFEAQDEGKMQLLFSSFTIGEVIRCFFADTHSPTGISLCNTLLRCSNWRLLPEVPILLRCEIENPGKDHVFDASLAQQPEMTSLLEVCARGEIDHRLKEQYAAFAAKDATGYRAYEEVVKSTDPCQELRFEWPQDCYSERMRSFSIDLLRAHSEREGIVTNSDQLDRLASLVTFSPGRVPTLASFARLRAWSIGRIQTTSTIKKDLRKDLRWLRHTLSADVVATRDKDVREIVGKCVFPEVSFRDSIS